jgi:pimeloyl-ACP methyl ester carboxylesterase
MITKILSDNLTYSQVNSENPKICFLHGWGGESNNWKNISGEFESIALDIPGFGKSVPFEKSFSPKTYAEYLIDIIPDSVEIIVGHSYGGRIAVHLSRLKKYKKIVVIASPLVKVDKTKDSISIFKFYKFIHKINLISDEKLEKIKKKYGSEDYKNANKYLRDTLVMAVNDDLVQILPKIDTHVDLIYGEYDTTVLPQNGTTANKIIPDSDLTILPKENHFCLNSSKEKIIEIIKR